MPTITVELTEDETGVMKKILPELIRRYGRSLKIHRDGGFYHPHPVGAKKQKPVFAHRVAAFLKLDAALHGRGYQEHIIFAEQRLIAKAIKETQAWERRSIRYYGASNWTQKTRDRNVRALSYATLRP